MKVGIVIPLKPSSASRNWNATCQLLQNTLRSVSAQSSKDYQAVVVGHQRPQDVNFENTRVSFSSIETEPPTLYTAEDFATDNRRFTLDKNRKIVRGLQLLQDNSIDYWFVLDADDLLHRDFVRTISRTEAEGGMLINGGYLIYPGLRRAIRRQDMVTWCGSTSVLSDRYISIPDSLDEDEIEKLPWCRYAHMNMANYYEQELKRPYHNLTEPLLGYVLGHGDNCSDGYRVNFLAKMRSQLKPWIIGKRMNPDLLSQFSLLNQ